jgi:hypothetical protein
LCDEATKKSRKGKDILVVSNPQVINGQQTTRTLASRPDLAAKASVLVKVIQVTRGEATDGFEGLVSRIVQGTNWQNAIKQSDLMANDRIQIDLERSLRKLGYAYLRKRITKGEAKVLAGGKHYRFVRKETFAQAVAACDLEPYIARSASEKLFEEEYYSKVFPNSDPHFYLPRYLLLHEVLYVARRHAPYREPKWLVLNYVWSHLASKIQSIKGARAFTRMCESQDDNLVVPLNAAIGRVFAAALKFFRSNQGTGDDRVEVANFFKSTRCKAKAFSDFLQQDATFEKQLSKAVAAIENFEC